MRLEGKTVGIMVEDLYEDLELWYPYYRLLECGVKVELIAPFANRQFHSKHGYPVQPTMDIKQALEYKFDALIIPGGYSPDRMRRTPEMITLVANAVKKGLIVAAICHGPWMLCSAGALQGKRATSYSSIKDDVVNAGRSGWTRMLSATEI